MTIRSTAIYNAKQAFSLRHMTGKQNANLVAFDAAPGERRYKWVDANGYIVILKHASDYREIGGAIDAARTKAANSAPDTVATPTQQIAALKVNLRNTSDAKSRADIQSQIVELEARRDLENDDLRCEESALNTWGEKLAAVYFATIDQIKTETKDKKMTNIEIQIPFAGFYCSIHENAFDHELENIADSFAESMTYDIPKKLSDMFFRAADFGNAHQEYAKSYAIEFAGEYLNDDIEFAAMTSPREYNFETDRVFIKVTRKTIAKIWRGADKSIFERICRERHTSRDGFISHYSNDWRAWGRLSSWDHNQYMTLLLAYLETERGEEWDQWAEWALCEDFDCNGEMHSWLWQGDKSDRAWRIFNYLTHDRPNRAVKTMAQWRVAYVKPWETTPLGATQ